MTKTFQDEILFGFSNFGHWKLFDIWDFNKSMNFQQSKSPLGITKAGSSGTGYLLSGYLSYRIEHLSIKESVKRSPQIYLVNTDGTVSENMLRGFVKKLLRPFEVHIIREIHH